MIRSYRRAFIGALCCLGSGACAWVQRPMPGEQALAPQQAPSPLGFVEHQGRRYELRDLMDPAYRAASTDEFVRGFSPDTALADRTTTRMSFDQSRLGSIPFSSSSLER